MEKFVTKEVIVPTVMTIKPRSGKVERMWVVGGGVQNHAAAALSPEKSAGT
jgi:hypothetical protein